MDINYTPIFDDTTLLNKENYIEDEILDSVNEMIFHMNGPEFSSMTEEEKKELAINLAKNNIEIDDFLKAKEEIEEIEKMPFYYKDDKEPDIEEIISDFVKRMTGEEYKDMSKEKKVEIAIRLYEEEREMELETDEILDEELQ